jgi:single-stranded-DNA-specific exonuclease
MKSPKFLNQYLPLVAIATIADCQSIKDISNRILVKAGLSILNKLIKDEKINLKPFLNKNILYSTDLGFYLSPLLNSAGRIAHANLSIDFLTEIFTIGNSEDKLIKLVGLNNQRKIMVTELLLTLKIEKYKSANQIFIVNNWNKGVIGIIASRLVNEYKLPSILVAIETKSIELYDETEKYKITKIFKMQNC